MAHSIDLCITVLPSIVGGEVDLTDIVGIEFLAIIV